MIPGGHTDIRGTSYGNATNLLLSLASSRPEEKFAVWGTCQGFQQLAQFASESPHSILHSTDSEDLALPLNITVDSGHILTCVVDLPTVAEQLAHCVLNVPRPMRPAVVCWATRQTACYKR